MTWITELKPSIGETVETLIDFGNSRTIIPNVIERDNEWSVYHCIVIGWRYKNLYRNLTSKKIEDLIDREYFYKQGVKHSKKDMCIHTNPCEKGTPEFIDWENGWLDARMGFSTGIELCKDKRSYDKN